MFALKAVHHYGTAPDKPLGTFETMEAAKASVNLLANSGDWPEVHGAELEDVATKEKWFLGDEKWEAI